MLDGNWLITRTNYAHNIKGTRQAFDVVAETYGGYDYTLSPSNAVQFTTYSDTTYYHTYSVVADMIVSYPLTQTAAHNWWSTRG